MLDVVVLIIMALGFYLGFTRGIVKTLFDTLSLVVAILAALKLSPIVIGILQKIMSNSPKAAYLLGVVFTFIGVIFLVRFIGRKIEDAMEAVHINFVNKLMGGGLQSLFFAYLLSLAVWLINYIGLIKQETKDNSVTYSFVEALPEMGKSVFKAAKPVFTGFWDKTSEVMDGVKKSSDKNGEKKTQ